MIDARLGDSRELLKTLADASLDACVTDPPYDLKFMGKAWDTGDTAHDPTFWREVYRVLKPGAHVVAFAGTRTYHRLACAIEDAGFEIRDMVAWVYGNGFPKSHDVSKGIDKAAGAERADLGPSQRHHGGGTNNVYAQDEWTKANFANKTRLTAPASAQSAAWEGWGTALKPALEPIVLARKPLSERTVAANVLRWGTGALNIDACRVEGLVPKPGNINPTQPSGVHGILGADNRLSRQAEWEPSAAGRWPANVIHDGSDEVVEAFPPNAGAFAPIRGTETSVPAKGDVVYGFRERVPALHHGDSGSAARFFYTAKADAEDRLGSKHPTVKPVDLMRWLCRIVTPPGGRIIDTFAGTGTTGLAAEAEGFDSILFESDPDYFANIERRLAWARGEAIKTTGQIIAERKEQKPAGGMFEGVE